MLKRVSYFIVGFKSLKLMKRDDVGEEERWAEVPLGDNRGGAESEPGQTVATPNNDTGTLSVVTHFIMSACIPTVHWLNVVTAISCIYQTLVFVFGITSENICWEHGRRRRGSHSHRLYKHLWEGNPWCPRGTIANIWAAPCSVSLDTFIITLITWPWPCDGPTLYI